MDKKNDTADDTLYQSAVSFLVGEGGFEPPKLSATDLQSAPFGRSGIFPHWLELVMGIEPATY